MIQILLECRVSGLLKACGPLLQLCLFRLSSATPTCCFGPISLIEQYVWWYQRLPLKLVCGLQASENLWSFLVFGGGIAARSRLCLHSGQNFPGR
jgi:hypothetical protein